MKTETNASMKHLLSQDEAYAWDEIREATWDVASITADMRESQIKRVVGEIHQRMLDIVRPYNGVGVGHNPFARKRMEMEIEQLLRDYNELGTLDDWSIQSATIGEERRYDIRTNLLVTPVEKIGFSFHVE